MDLTVRWRCNTPARTAPASQSNCISQCHGGIRYSNGTASHHLLNKCLVVCQGCGGKPQGSTSNGLLRRKSATKHSGRSQTGSVQLLPTCPTLQYSRDRKMEKYQPTWQSLCTYKYQIAQSAWYLNKLNTGSFNCFITHDAVPQLDLPCTNPLWCAMTKICAPSSPCI